MGPRRDHDGHHAATGDIPMPAARRPRPWSARTIRGPGTPWPRCRPMPCAAAGAWTSGPAPRSSGPEAAYDLDVHFRDSHMGEDGIETVVHEYSVTGGVDPSGATIAGVTARADVLPWMECPGALASAERLAGLPVVDFRGPCPSGVQGHVDVHPSERHLAVVGRRGALGCRADGSRRHHRSGAMRAGRVVSPLLAPLSTDEFDPLPLADEDRRAGAKLAETLDDGAPRIGLRPDEHAIDRRGTAAVLRAIDEAHGGGFYAVASEAELDAAAADEMFAGVAPVIDVQTHFIDPGRWDRPGAAPLSGFLQMADPERWNGEVDPHLIDAARWASLLFGTSETAVALLTSTPGSADDNVLTNPQIAAAREVVDRYAGTGRVLTHTIVHPNLGSSELKQMAAWRAELSPSGWKVYTLYGPPTAASPTGGWFLDDEEIGLPFLEQVRRLGPRVVATHKGLGGPIPDASVAAASPRDVGPAAVAFPDIDFVVYHSGYERDPTGREGPYDATVPNRGVDRLVATVTQAGIGHHGNVYAELGSTWFSCCAGRPRRPTCSGSCWWPWAPTGSCGAPTRSGTGHRSR